VVLVAALMARAASSPGCECVVTLGNSDRMRGRLEKLADGRLFFYPAVAPQTCVQIDLGKVDRLTFREPPKGEQPPKGELLTLRDSSVLCGRFVKLTADALHFDLEGTGPLAFPRSALNGLVAAKVPRALPTPGDLPRPPPAATACGTARERRRRWRGAPSKAPRDIKQHVVVLKSGAVLIGGLEQEAGGLLVVSGGAVEASFRYAAIANITFPGPSTAKPAGSAKKGPALDAEEEDEEEGPTARLTGRLQSIVTTRRGTRLNGTDARLEDGRIALTLAGGHRVKLPLGEIVEMSFTSTGAAAVHRAVLVWGAYSDRSEEFPRTTAILKEHLGSGWQIAENFSPTFDSSFRSELSRSGVLLIPEMERWRSSSNTPQLAPALKPLAERFLRRGGNIVVLGTTGSQTSFLAQAGLLDVQQATNSSGSQVTFTPEGRRIAQGVGESFRTTNATQFYRIGSSMKAIALAGSATSAPIVARRVGCGWVVLMGMDYYESNDQTKKLLINAITHR
jgi:hypothetical protein